jgi:hypothetical protein
MKDLPATGKTLVIRTDFLSDSRWAAVCRAMSCPAQDLHFRDEILCLSDPDYAGLSAARLTEIASRGQRRHHAFLADTVAVAQQDHPVLVVDLADDPMACTGGPGPATPKPCRRWSTRSSRPTATAAERSPRTAAVAAGLNHVGLPGRSRDRQLLTAGSGPVSPRGAEDLKRDPMTNPLRAADEIAGAARGRRSWSRLARRQRQRRCAPPPPPPPPPLKPCSVNRRKAVRHPSGA